MKKEAVLVITGIFVLSVSACGGHTAAAGGQGKEGEGMTEERVPDGEWTRADSPEITDAIRRLTEQASGGLVGAKYTPAAYIGSLAGEGTDHAVLCEITPVIPDAVPAYAVVRIHEDPDGGAAITEVLGSEAKAEAARSGPLGGWTASESPVVSEEARSAFEKAVPAQEDFPYEPAALLETQLVSGMNYSVFCVSEDLTSDGTPRYAIVHVYEALDGSAEITEIYGFGTEEGSL